VTRGFVTYSLIECWNFGVVWKCLCSKVILERLVLLPTPCVRGRLKIVCGMKQRGCPYEASMFESASFGIFFWKHAGLVEASLVGNTQVFQRLSRKFHIPRPSNLAQISSITAAGLNRKSYRLSPDRTFEIPGRHPGRRHGCRRRSG